MCIRDRSWYSRALIQPAMGYCSENQYKYFMKKVNNFIEKPVNESGWINGGFFVMNRKIFDYLKNEIR